VKTEGQLGRAAAHQAESDPKQRQPGRPPPPSIYEDVFGGKKGGGDRNAQARLDQATPGDLLYRGNDGSECHQLNGERVRWRLVWLVAEKGAAQRVPREDKRDTDQQRQRTAIAAGPWSAIAQGGRAKKRIRGQPRTGAGRQKAARHRLTRGDGGCPQERLQSDRFTERR
jgi:hypothetical protein